MIGKPRVLILRMRNVPAIDATGMHALGEVIRGSRRNGTLVLLSDVHSQPMIALGRSHLLDEIGDDHIFGSIDDALERARAELGLIGSGARRACRRVTHISQIPIPLFVIPDSRE